MSDKTHDPNLSENSAFLADDDAIALQKEERIRALRKKLAGQQKKLISAAEKSYLENGNLLHGRVAEEADKYFQLLESFDNGEDESGHEGE